MKSFQAWTTLDLKVLQFVLTVGFVISENFIITNSFTYMKKLYSFILNIFMIILFMIYYFGNLMNKLL